MFDPQKVNKELVFLRFEHIENHTYYKNENLP